MRENKGYNKRETENTLKLNRTICIIEVHFIYLSAHKYALWHLN